MTIRYWVLASKRIYNMSSVRDASISGDRRLTTASFSGSHILPSKSFRSAAPAFSGTVCSAAPPESRFRMVNMQENKRRSHRGPADWEIIEARCNSAAYRALVYLETRVDAHARHCSTEARNLNFPF